MIDNYLSEFNASQFVIPSSRKIPTVDRIESRIAQQVGPNLPSFWPDQTHVSRASGGFNSVVQVSANASRNYLARRIGAVEAVVRSNAAVMLRNLSKETPIVAKELQRNLISAGYREVVLEISAKLQNVRFGGFGTATLTYHGGITIPPRTSLQEAGETQAGLSRRTADRENVARPDKMAMVPTAEQSFADGITKPIAQVGIAITFEFELELSAPLELMPFEDRKAVDLVVDLSKASLKLTPLSETTAFLYRLHADMIDRLLAEQLFRDKRLEILPTISLVGASAASEDVPEFTDFEVRMGVVESIYGQAVFVAFDVVPGCKGVTRSVEHFVGWHDYGVIHDDYVIQRVLLHKWNRGGFDRELRVSAVTQVSVERNGDTGIEDARVDGVLELDTLDTVVLEVDADSRMDTIRLGGACRSIAEKLTLLADGAVIDRDHADLGPAETSRWGVRLAPLLAPVSNPDPEIAEFQVRAHEDGARHLSRPFVKVEAANPTYVRTESVLKRFYVLGDLN